MAIPVPDREGPELFRPSSLPFVACALILLAGCAHRDSTAQTALGATPVPTALPPAPESVGPPGAPAWITELSPQGKADVGAQIRIRFADDIVPLEALEAPDRQDALSKIEIDPPIPGHFIFVTPRMVTFSAERPLPRASRILVTLHAGLTDGKGNVLDHDVSYGFRTEPLVLSFPSGGGSPQGARPRVVVNANLPIDEQSLEAHATLEAPGASPIPLVVAHDATDSPDPAATPEGSSSFDDEPSATYALVPARDVPLATTYTVTVAAGVRPKLGNVPADATISTTATTYGPLAFSGVTFDTSVESRPFESGNPELNFSTGLDAGSAGASISISPKAKSGYTLLAPENGSGTVDLNPNALAPNTTYTVTIAAGLKDEFGQTLATPATATFHTGALAPELWASGGFSIFPATADVALDVTTANLPGDAYAAHFKTLRPSDLVADDPRLDDDLTAVLGDDKKWNSKQAPPARDVESTTAVPLARALGSRTGLLAYGVATDATVAGAQATHTRLQGAVEVTNVGVFAQWFPSGGFVRAHHLSDGRPIADANVEIYESKPASPANANLPCARGTTDATGTLALTNATFARCLSTATADDEAPALLAIVRDGSDWSYVRTDSYGSGLGDTYESWSAGTPHARGTFISDRSLYQRGEPAYFTAVAYFERSGNLGRGASSHYAVSMKSPQGKVVALGSYAPDAFGAFNLHATIAPDADLGDWTISAKGQRGETIDSTFTVAQFKPPNFKVALALDRPVVVQGEQVSATTTSTYLFGTPVEGAKDHVAVTRSRSSFMPKGYESYDLGPLYLYPDEPPSLDSDVTQADVRTGPDGTTAVPVAVATDLPFPAEYRVDTETTDVSNLAVSDSKTFTALPSSNLIMLRGDFLGAAASAYKFDLAVVDAAGVAVAGRTVHITLARRTYDDASQIVEGGVTDRPGAHETLDASLDVTSTSAVQHLSITPSKAGEYRLRANFSDAAGTATATDLDVYVAGDGADWYRAGDTSLSVKLDKPVYHTGDRATALVASPYADAEMLFAIVRGTVIERKILTIHGSSVRIPFTVTRDMSPNVVVEAVLVREGTSLASGVPAGLHDLSREGFAALHVALDSDYLKVAIVPGAPSTAPGGTQSVMLHVTDASGAPVRSELTVAVANDAILQLSGYRFPDLVTSIYADEPVSMRYADNRVDVKLATERRPVDKGFGYGGGVMAGPAGTRVRTNFRPIAYFNGAVLTDAHGDARVSFALPDDLTTWRVLAIALSRDARFGKNDATFITTKPLVTNPILPAFARPGDTLEGGVSVTNVSAVPTDASAASVDVSGTLAGALHFTDPEGATASRTDTFSGRTAGYRFAMAVDAARAASPGRALPDAHVTFHTSLSTASDAFTVALPIVSEDTLEDVVETGTTTGTASVPLTVDPLLPTDTGGLHVTIASTLLGDTLAPLDAVLSAPDEPFGFETAARIAIASDRLMLERRYHETADLGALRAGVTRDLALLRPLARTDGSYAFFPNGPGDPFTSAFVAIQLVQARSAGIDVNSQLRAIEGYLLGELADPQKTNPNCDALCRAETRLEALETLAPMGMVRSDHLSEIYDLRDQLSVYERVELARHLVRIKAWHDRGIGLRDRLLQQLSETGRRAGLVEANDFDESVVDGQSQLLGLMIETGIEGYRIDKTFASLLASRGRDGTWGCACDDAEAMNAIVLYAARDIVPPKFTGTAVVGTDRFSQRFDGYATTQATKDYAIPDLPQGASHIALTRAGTGTLHYTVDFDYAVRGPSPGAYQGIRIDRIVRAAGAVSAPVATFGLATPAGPSSFAAGQVFDIEDRITTDHPLEGLVVTDPLPAGLEAIDTRFQTNSAEVFESVSDWNIDYQTIERSRVLTYATSLQPGVYAFHYLVRSVTPGSYAWPAASASLALAPDEFGRTAAGTLTITDK